MRNDVNSSTRNSALLGFAERELANRLLGLSLRGENTAVREETTDVWGPLSRLTIFVATDTGASQEGETGALISLNNPTVSEPLDFEKMATTNPRRLIEILTNAVLEPYVLSFAVDASGLLPSTETLSAALLQLLSHRSPIVREAAIHAVADHPSPRAISVLRELAKADENEDVRHAARDVVSEL